MHPEPKSAIIKVFLYGAAISLPAIAIEKSVFWGGERLSMSLFATYLFDTFLGVALTEEFLKFLAVDIGISKSREFDEPVDAMIYMITAAMGFAAAENILIVFQIKPLAEIFEVSLFRFLGATFLHALASGICGIFIGLSFYKRRGKWKMVSIGLFFAVLLHGFYDFYIMKGEGGLNILVPLLLLLVSAVLVSMGFKRLKKIT